MSELQTINDASPFDAIKRVTPEGREYWSARDLMPLLGYEKWERFADAIGRAKVAAHNAGYVVAEQFPGAGKMVDTGNGARRQIEDYHLSRYACYLIALNGDPRKDEIAKAQTYFVIKTRQAETALPTGPELLARAVLEAQAMLEAKDAKIAELEPKAEVADRLLDAEGDLSVRDAAQALTRAGVKVGQNRLFSTLESRYRWISRSPGDGRWRVKQSAIEAGYMSVIPQSHYHPKTGVLVLDPPQPRVTPKGLQRILTDHGGVS